MKFLEKYGFNQEDIDEFFGNTPKKMIDELNKHQSLVEENLKFTKDLGIKTYKEIFINYPDMFLMDNSNFTEMFTKYKTEELLEKLNNNYKMVEYL